MQTQVSAQLTARVRFIINGPGRVKLYLASLLDETTKIKTQIEYFTKQNRMKMGEKNIKTATVLQQRKKRLSTLKVTVFKSFHWFLFRFAYAWYEQLLHINRYTKEKEGRRKCFRQFLLKNTIHKRNIRKYVRLPNSSMKSQCRACTCSISQNNGSIKIWI